MSNVYNGVVSEHEIPNVATLYKKEGISSLPKMNLDIPMPSVKFPSGKGDRLCGTCDKEDVCMYKMECAQAAKEITKISKRENVFIDTDVRCKKWSKKISNTK